MYNENERLRLPVTINMNDDRELTGDVIVNIGGTLERTLNNEAKFILFGDSKGSERMIAKSGILEVTAHKKSKVAGLPGTQSTQGNSSSSNPYEVLGIEKTASDEDIQRAYAIRAKSYHPDRFASVPLPREVSDYVNAMSRQINEAHAQLMKGKTPSLSQEPDTIYAAVG